MPTHAEIYRRVCEARPECKVANIEWAEHTLWTLCGKCSYADICIPLITDHWTEMLPEGYAVVRMFRGIGQGVYGVEDFAGSDSPIEACPSRFHALAEFLVPGSTKEKA